MVPSEQGAGWALGTAAAALLGVAVIAVLYAGRQHHFATEQERATREITGLAERLNASLVESNRRLAIRNLERGQTYFERGQTGPGLLWMIESWRSAIGARDRSLARAARVNLSAWLPEHPPITAVFSHDAPVVSTACSPDGKIVLTGSEDQTARLWDASTGQAVGSPLPHSSPVTSVAFSPDGKSIATASRDGIRLWDATAPGRRAHPWRPWAAKMRLVFRHEACNFRRNALTMQSGDGIRPRHERTAGPSFSTKTCTAWPSALMVGRSSPAAPTTRHASGTRRADGRSAGRWSIRTRSCA